MDFFERAIGVFLHLDTYLQTIVREYGLLTYVLITVTVFCETGLVVTPFLPGDSLLFAAGAIAAVGGLNVVLLFALLAAAAILGDSVNYAIGAFLGRKVFSMNTWFFKHEHLVRAEEFYERHGGKTIILARFIPILRTFAPFVAGVGSMHYGRFLFYNVCGALLWVSLFLLGGYFFGRVPWVQENFEYVILGIIAVSILPGILRWGIALVQKVRTRNIRS